MTLVWQTYLPSSPRFLASTWSVLFDMCKYYTYIHRLYSNTHNIVVENSLWYYQTIRSKSREYESFPSPILINVKPLIYSHDYSEQSMLHCYIDLATTTVYDFQIKSKFRFFFSYTCYIIIVFNTLNQPNDDKFLEQY